MPHLSSRRVVPLNAHHRHQAEVRHPISLRDRTRLALSVASKELAEYAAAMVATYGEDGVREAFLDCSRVVAVLFQRYRCLSVLLCRAENMTWQQIGDRLGLTAGTARRLYGDAEARWLAGDPAPWEPLTDGLATGRVYGAPIPIGDANAAQLAGDLEAFVRRMDDDAPRHPVIEGLHSLTA